MSHTLHGTAVSLFITPPGDSPVGEARGIVDVPFEGFAGDKHAGFTRRADSHTPAYPRGTEMRNARQVSIVSEEDLAAIAGSMGVPYILPEWLGANILVRGIPDLTHVPPTSTLHFPEDAALVVYKMNKPCRTPGRVILAQFPQVETAEAFVSHAKELRGLLAWVERPGRIRAGDAIRVEVPAQVIYSFGSESE